MLLNLHNKSLNGQPIGDIIPINLGSKLLFNFDNNRLDLR